MATQQVKFHSVSTAQYNDVKRPINEGSLYFIDDNGEIRKGGKHVTGTRVFKATDPSTGACSPVETLDIKIDGQSISKLVQKQTNDGEDLYLDADGNETTSATHTEGEGDDAQEVDNEKAMILVPDTDVEQPKRGDMLVVDHEISTGKHEFSAYIYAANGGAYDASKWLACDGNVDASKVILTQNFTLAGDYDKVGNIKLSENQFNATGLSVADALTKIFTKELDNSTKTDPTFSLSGSNASVEIGTLYAAQTYTGTWKDGSYGYGAFVSAGNTQTATGAKVGTWTITAYDGKTEADATKSGNTASITTDALRVAEAKSYTLATFNVTNDLSEIKKAATNLKNESASIVISKTSNTAISRTVTGYKNMFYGVSSFPSSVNEKGDKLMTWSSMLEENGVDSTPSTNKAIRALNPTKITAAGNVKLKLSAGYKQVFIAVPKPFYVSDITSEAQYGSSVLGNYTKNEKVIKIGGADSSDTSIGGYSSEYNTYHSLFDDGEGADTLTITFSK